MPKGKGRKGGRVPATLGRSLINKHQRQAVNPKRSQFYAGVHCTDIETDNGAGRLASVVHRNELDEFLCNALLAERDFTAEHPNPVIIMNHDRSLDAKEAEDGDDDRHEEDDGDEEEEEEDNDNDAAGDAADDDAGGLPSRALDANVQIVDTNKLQVGDIYDYADLPIPRRPKWDAETTPDELDRSEREAFLEWRRSLNKMEEVSHMTVTPFEKNLEVWRQLWRVLERSDMVAQIVDARDPLLFRCADLVRVAKETDPQKTVMLVVNKSDLLSPYMRKVWADYFAAHDIEFVFFSAYQSQQAIDNATEEASAAGTTVAATPASRGTPSAAPSITGPIAEADEANESEDEQEVRVPVALNVLQEPDETDGKEHDEQEDDEDDDDDEEDQDGKAEKPAQQPVQAFAPADNKSAAAAPAVVATAALPAPEAVPSPASAVAPVAPVAPVSSAVSPPASTAASVNGAATDGEDDEEELLLDPAVRVLGREELLDYFREKYRLQLAASNNTYVPVAARKETKDGQRSSHVTIGMVGYPNVGKSSTINVLMGKKKVSVGPTPGKTKHFQTLFLTNDLCLCDCPGLVFPTFMSSAAELVISGILPIDQTRDYITPVRLLCRRLYPVQFYLQYGLRFVGDRPGLVDADRLLTGHATMRGFFKDAGRPDDSRSARQVLKDFVSGKLLACKHPPSLSGDQRSRFARETLRAAVHNAFGGQTPAVASAVSSAIAAEYRPGHRDVHDLDSLTAAVAAAAAKAAANPLDKFDEKFLAPAAAPSRPQKPLSKKKERRKLLQLKKVGRRTKGKTRNMVPENMDLADVHAITIGAMGQQLMPGAVSKLGPRPVPGASS